MKIKVKNKGFNTTHYGFLAPNTEREVSKQFAQYCVEKMKSADYVEVRKKRAYTKKANTEV